MSIRKAVIPAAGRGTRMAALAPAGAKEMLPVGRTPLIQLAVQEAVTAGIGEIAIVIGPGKESISDHLVRLQGAGSWPGLELQFVEQSQPRGLADALDCCRSFADGEPFAVLLPDNVPLSPDYCLCSLMRLHEEFGKDVLGVIEVGFEDRELYANLGRIDFDEIRPGVLRIRHLQGKQPGTLRLKRGQRLRRGCGRSVCHWDFFEFVDRVRPQLCGEFDDVPVLQEIISQRGAIGCLIPQPLFDAGHPAGYRAACRLLEDP